MSRNNIFFSLIVCLILGVSLASSCRKDDFTTSASARLTYSDDTLRFDTIITQLGSITNAVMIYNRGSSAIHIESVSMSKGSQSGYTIAINGQRGKDLHNIDIHSGDSLFVFVQALLTSNGHDSIQFHNENLEIRYNCNTDQVPVTAWGIDAQKCKAQRIEQNTVWASHKGFLIYDSLVIAPNARLTIEAGSKLFFYGKANLIVYGTLEVKGTLDNPVLFHSHRLDSAYQQRYGQWGSIIFKPGSRNNDLNYADIMNATTGLMLTADPKGQIDIRLTNSKIENMTYAAIFAQNAKITASNCVFADCSINILRLTEGGNYDFRHVTISNYDYLANRYASGYSVYVNNYRDAQAIPLQSFSLMNSIIVGNHSNEIKLDPQQSGDFNAKLGYCLIQQDSANLGAWITSGVISRKANASSRIFLESTYDLRLDSLSEARDKADLTIASELPTDKLGNSRLADGKPDLGAMEFVSRKKK